MCDGEQLSRCSWWTDSRITGGREIKIVVKAVGLHNEKIHYPFAAGEGLYLT